MTPDARAVLVVEDEALIAMDIQLQLEDGGWSVIGPAGTSEKALDLLEATHPRFAVLDINLGRKTSYDVADNLAARGVPFLFLSGGTKEVLPDRFRARPLLQKPIRYDELLRHVGDIGID